METPQKSYFNKWKKGIYFLHDELKRKNTVINLLPGTLIKYKDEIRNIYSNHDLRNIQLGKNIKTAKSVETKEYRVYRKL